MKKALLLLLILGMQGCTVVHYNSHGLSKPSSSLTKKNCEVSYFIEAVGFHKERTQKTLSQYNQTAKETFDALGCNNKLASESAAADLVVLVNYKGHGGAAGQEYLTGLSLGIIPSWFTRESMYTYTVSSQANSKTYNLDHVSYNHLILFPLIWLNLLTDSEQEHFSSVLTDFIKNT